ncbi:HTH-type transcriptional regulator LrpC [Ensifer sp. M14]|jgi:Lrp/AsnC family leucine-responsive transcriptional regulator|uniref:Lrp/AsnC family transcriptional regulator n=1 Tax=Sinorhizobium/Ensifer group TaxID=227292 RepID=UPI000985F432|nr:MULTISPECIES: Lrp/AsnC family transcriptional regulator [Sinorhizobium/Ensifer group]OOG68995.1 AsnC family transcriptional regulator [Sinorhizobium sp. A49]RDL48229.1 HTH-type transcriptional regulator LrpC [Ensifer sp. M14]
MDEIDRKIIGILAQDSRRSLTDIGAAVELSPSSVNERIRRLVTSGVVRRFTIDADHRALGLDVLAFVWVGLSPDADEEAFRTFMADHPSVAECHHVTGAWSYCVKVRMPSLGDIEPFLAELKRRRFLARSETVIALSTVRETQFTSPER